MVQIGTNWAVLTLRQRKKRKEKKINEMKTKEKNRKDKKSLKWTSLNLRQTFSDTATVHPMIVGQAVFLLWCS